MPTRLFAAIALLILHGAARAQTTAAPAPAAPKLADKLAVYWDTPLYPAEAKALHEQGTAQVSMEFVNGKAVGAPTLVASSKSPRLDQAALGVASQLSFAAEGGADATLTQRLIIPVEFVRDSHLTLNTKTCLELRQDVAYFRRIHPELPLQKMRVYELTLGIYTIAYMQVSMQAAIKASKVVPAAFDATVVQCEAKPDALFTDLLKAELKKAM